MATPDSTTCPQCGNEGLTLAIEVVQYRELYIERGSWRASPVRHQEVIDSKGESHIPERVFCPHCGAHFQAPDVIRNQHGDVLAREEF